MAENAALGGLVTVKMMALRVPTLTVPKLPFGGSSVSTPAAAPD